MGDKTWFYQQKWYDELAQAVKLDKRVMLECPHCHSDNHVLPDEPLGNCWRCGTAFTEQPPDIDQAQFMQGM